MQAARIPKSTLSQVLLYINPSLKVIQTHCTTINKNRHTSEEAETLKRKKK